MDRLERNRPGYAPVLSLGKTLFEGLSNFSFFREITDATGKTGAAAEKGRGCAIAAPSSAPKKSL